MKLYKNFIISLILLSRLYCQSSEMEQKDLDTKLFLAIHSENVDNIRNLLKKKANINATYDIGKQTPLMMAAQISKQEILDVLLSHKPAPELNQQCLFGDTALTYALYHLAESSDKNLISILSLIQAKADPTIENRGGRSFKDLLSPKENDTLHLKALKYWVTDECNKKIQE